MVEAVTLGAVVGFMIATGLGLFLVASCHFIGLGRLTLLATCVWLGPWHSSGSNIDAYPAFGQALFSEPREVTGKIVCSNCHLGTKDVLFNVPALTVSGKIAEATLSIPSLKTNAALTSDGSVGRLNVGGVLVFPEELAVNSELGLSPWRVEEAAGSYVFGPKDSRAVTTGYLSWRVPVSEVGLSKTFYVAVNRGRGQLYPDGSQSNLAAWRLVDESVQRSGLLVTGLSYQAKRYGSQLHFLGNDGVWTLHVPTGQLVNRDYAPRTSVRDSSANLGSFINLGGLGQTEQTISIQPTGTVATILGYVLCLHLTQLALL